MDQTLENAKRQRGRERDRDFSESEESIDTMDPSGSRDYGRHNCSSSITREKLQSEYARFFPSSLLILLKCILPLTRKLDLTGNK